MIQVCFLLLVLITTSPPNIKAQAIKKQRIEFNAVFKDSSLLLHNKYYSLSEKDSISVDELKLYISKIELLNNDVSVFKEANSFHLIDFANTEIPSIILSLPQDSFFNKIKFNLGIDSVTNVSGALGGDLDPTKGMYWAWQSGYINFKLEGKSNVCTTRNNEFQFHLGGYQSPYNAMQTIVLDVNGNKKINVLLNIEEILKVVDLKNRNHIMSPCTEAVKLSEEIKKSFSIRQ